MTNLFLEEMYSSCFFAVLTIVNCYSEGTVEDGIVWNEVRDVCNGTDPNYFYAGTFLASFFHWQGVWNSPNFADWIMEVDIFLLADGDTSWCRACP